ncbi:MAG: hypothetical protein ACKOPO_05630 [Novosphingobium sp.]
MAASAATANAQDRKVAPVAVAPSPAPPVMIPPPPPIMIAPAPSAYRSQNNLPMAVFQVELIGGTERLWSGQLRLNSYNSASFNSTINEAMETCPADKANLGRYAPNFSRSVRVGLSRRNYGYGSTENSDEFAVSATWTRPGIPCQEDGTSSVSFDRPVTMTVGARTEIKGDGGLVVRLTRVK